MKRLILIAVTGFYFVGLHANPVIVEGDGTQAYGLRARVVAERTAGDWAIEIDVAPQSHMTNDLAYRWLKALYPFGARVRLLQREASRNWEIESKSPLLTAPRVVKLQRLFNSFKLRSMRGLLWLHIRPGVELCSGRFRLSRFFDTDFRASYTLEVIPLLYHVRNDGETANLKEMPSIRLLLPALASETARKPEQATSFIRVKRVARDNDLEWIPTVGPTWTAPLALGIGVLSGLTAIWLWWRRVQRKSD